MKKRRNKLVTLGMAAIENVKAPLPKRFSPK